MCLPSPLSLFLHKSNRIDVLQNRTSCFRNRNGIEKGDESGEFSFEIEGGGEGEGEKRKNRG